MVLSLKREPVWVSEASKESQSLFTGILSGKKVWAQLFRIRLEPAQLDKRSEPSESPKNFGS